MSFEVSITEKGGQTTRKQFDQPEITIGRVQDNDIVLPKSNISKRHAKIVNNDGAFVVIDSKSTNGTYINGKRIDAPFDLQSGDKIFVGDFTLEVHGANDASTSQGRASPRKGSPPPPPDLDDDSSIGKSDDDFLSDEDWGASPSEEWGDDWDKSSSAEDFFGEDEEEKPEPKATKRKQREPDPEPEDEEDEDEPPPPGDFDDEPPPPGDFGFDEEPAAEDEEEPEPEPPPSGMDPVETRTAAAKERPKSRKSKRKPRKPAPPPAEMGDELSVALRTVHERLVRSLDLRRMGVEEMDDEELRHKTREAVQEIVDAMADNGDLPGGVDADALIDNVLDEALGLGPLEDLLHDESINEILVNGAKQVFVERDGRLEVTDRVFSSDQAVMGVIERIVAPLGRRIDESSPMVDARLKDGSRVNAIIPPLAIDGPTLTIRKFSREPLQVDDLVVKSTLTPEMAQFLETSVRARKNVIISGGTGSGKTTTLNVLSGYIPESERIVTIEDAAELKLDQSHIVRLEARPPNIEGKGAIHIRDLVRNALRMRPDRIVVGECRGGEALDMLQAMNTGHDGSLTTVHANGPRDALSRLETMVLMSGMELPVRAIREQIASAIDIIVQQIRFPDGSRKVTHISEVTGIEGDVITMQDIFLFEQSGFGKDGRVAGDFKATGFIPRFYESLPAMGIEADLGIFQE